MRKHPERPIRPKVDVVEYSAHVKHTFEIPLSPAFGEDRGKVVCVLDIRESGVKTPEEDPAWEGSLLLTHNGVEIRFFSHQTTLSDASADTNPQKLLGMIAPKISVDFWTEVMQAGNDKDHISNLIEGLFSDLG